MTDNPAALLEKIKAISARTEANGCTEAEAMTAAAILARLLAEHGLSMSDVEIGEERCQTEYIDTGRKVLHEVRFCACAIANFTDCKVWEHRFYKNDAAGIFRSTSKGFAYFGLPGDVETAVYLTNMLKATMDREAIAYVVRAKQVGEAISGRRAMHSFMMGMATRVSQRLNELKANEQGAAKASTGRDLVVVKGAVVRKQFAELGIKLRSSTSRTTAGDHGAYGAGRAAGDRVGFNRGVGQAGGTALLR